MTRTPTEVATAAAERFRVLRERATAKLEKARSDAVELRARRQRESKEMMAEAKRRKEGGEPEERPAASPWPNQRPEAVHYRFDDTPDTDHTAHDTEATPRPPRPAPAAEPARVDESRRDRDDDDMSEVDSWLR
ncbi:hypothetical protein [Actinophytocola sp.]|uniref:hypothetical protein n=1 Tax=Actinophytocola sp. TaxID=1872138 RepID=UPI003D6BE127